MKMVLNKQYGGFSLSKFAVSVLGVLGPHSPIDRSDENLISLIESEGSDVVSGSFAKLVIVDIPDNCTDHEIVDYDGMESVIYVVDGKIHHA